MTRRMRIAAVLSGVAALSGCGSVGTALGGDSPDSATLRQVLPFYRVAAPGWCEEDMLCWVGSTADGRSDAELLTAVRCYAAEDRLAECR